MTDEDDIFEKGKHSPNQLFIYDAPPGETYYELVKIYLSNLIATFKHK